MPVDNTVYAFHLKTQTWSPLAATGDVPPPRVGVTMAAISGMVYMFGGRDQSHKELNELYSFDTSAGKWALLWRTPLAPTARRPGATTPRRPTATLLAAAAMSTSSAGAAPPAA